MVSPPFSTTLVFRSHTCFIFRSVPCCVTREQLLSHVDVGHRPIHAVFVTIVLGVDVECYLLVDVSPAARLLPVNLSSPIYLLSRRASSPSLTCEKV